MPENTDPFGILASTKTVMEHDRFVTTNTKNLEKMTSLIADRFEKGVLFHQSAIEETGSFENAVQLIFLEDVTNFCFWAGKGESKWQVKNPNGTLTTGGWYGLESCFKRALREGLPILDAQYLAALSRENAALLFRGEDSIEIPLLEERRQNLREAGRVLLEKFDGQFANALQNAKGDAIEIVKLVIENFPSFRDVSEIDGTSIFFYKRAQILAEDLNYLFADQGHTLKNTGLLTAFADYKLPQILRMCGVLESEASLAGLIDNYVPVLHGTREEIEIRSASIQAIELLRRYLHPMTAADIDNTLWLMSQDIQDRAKPHHRARTIFY